MSKYRIFESLSSSFSRLDLDKPSGDNLPEVDSRSSTATSASEQATSVHPLTASFAKVHPPLMPPAPYPTRPIIRQVEYPEASPKTPSTSEPVLTKALGEIAMEGEE